jgi:hypothetical protein
MADAFPFLFHMVLPSRLVAPRHRSGQRDPAGKDEVRPTSKTSAVQGVL